METKVIQVASKNTKTGTSQRGAWTMFEITDTAGDKYKTFSEQVISAMWPQIGQGVNLQLQFETKQEGQFTNRTIHQVIPANSVPPPAMPQPAYPPSWDVGTLPATSTETSSILAPAVTQPNSDPVMKACCEMAVVRIHAMLESLESLGYSAPTPDAILSVTQDLASTLYIAKKRGQ